MTEEVTKIIGKLSIVNREEKGKDYYDIYHNGQYVMVMEVKKNDIYVFPRRSNVKVQARFDI